MKKTMLMLLLTFIFMYTFAPEYRQFYILKSKEESVALTWSNIDWWLIYYQVENIDIVKAQIWLETGNLTSKYCRENNNLLGMKLPKRRQSNALGELDGMSYYPSWIHSISDYKLWQLYCYKGGDYYEFLQNRPYAEDPLYIAKLQQVIALANSSK